VAIGRLIPAEDIQPNPRQPRQDLGDLSELVASIKEKGILEPILVRPAGGRYEIIAGERRFRAANEAGLADIPCIVRETSDAEMMELALVENLQRRDLSPFEEAEGLRTLAESYGYTHEMMAEKLGKSRSSITETLSLTAMPEIVRERCRRADIGSKSLLLQVVRQSDTQKMLGFIDRLEQHGTTRQEARRIAREGRRHTERGRPRHFKYHFQSKDKSFTLTVAFKKSLVTPEEIAAALQSAIDEIR
jgi:ParB family chromosome partitioning protein